MLVVNASNLEKDLKWLMDHKPDTVTIDNKSVEIGLIALQGPRSRDILQDVINEDLNDVSFYTFIEHNGMTIARTGYTGELGFEIYGDHNFINEVWDAIMDTGQVEPCGLGCRDTLRMEMKYCLYGNDIDETTNPIEAGLGWITKLGGDNFIGKEMAIQAKQEKIRHLAAFEMVDRAVPRKGYLIYADGKEVGEVTSGTQSPSLQKGIGLGYVQFGKHKPGMDIEIDIRGKMKKAVIIKPPFYKQGSAQS
jgi:aminomethyltransferase